MITRIVFNKLLGSWFVVRGPHDTPLSGAFATKADAIASLKSKRKPPAQFLRRANARLLDADPCDDSDDIAAFMKGL